MIIYSSFDVAVSRLVAVPSVFVFFLFVAFLLSCTFFSSALFSVCFLPFLRVLYLGFS